MTSNFIWKNGLFVPYSEATTHVLTHGLHYGTAVFEGIRCYKTSSGRSAVFALREHMERLLYSAQALDMKVDYTLDALCQAVTETLTKNQCKEGYIRPLIYYGEGPLRVLPREDFPIDVIIACWPWGKYLEDNAVHVKTSSYIRIHPQSTIADAKISGHYVNSFLAGLELKGTHYHEALLLDANGFVAEGSAENIFFLKDNKVYTTPKGTILMGITRKLVIQLIQDLGYEVVEQRFTCDDLLQAEEAFFTGTAVEVTAISSLDDQTIGTGGVGSFTAQVQENYDALVRGVKENKHHLLTFIE